jgi:DNA-directed RNA polymerase specialized sigma24 family protein
MKLPEVEADLLHYARRGNRRAMEQMLEMHYPPVHRIAHALTAREEVARRVLRFVMTRSLQVMPNWNQESAPTRWFYHHTVLSSRRENRKPPYPSEDPLFVQGSGPQTPYLAFLRALRELPVQQKEAFILHHGEELDTRYLGISMDCSREAAEQHLLSATQTLSAIAGGQFGAFTQRLREAYQGLTPPAHVIVPQVRRQVSRHMLPRRAKRWFGLLILLAVLVGLAYLALRLGWLVSSP